MQGKTVVITGATSGIGEVAALDLATKGARIVFVARDAVKATRLLQQLTQVGPTVTHDWVQADLTSLAAMKAAGEALAAKAPLIDVLINNAGVIHARREVTVDGLEKTFAVNHMAYFIITERLRGQINPAGGRVVSTASTAHNWAKLDFSDLQSKRRYSTMGAYGLSKLCNILWTRELARRLTGTGITANCLHPGGVATNFGHNNPLIRIVMTLAKGVMLTPAQGADTLIWLATSSEVEGKTGGYWSKRHLTTPSATAQDDVAATKLWDESVRIAGRA